MSLGDEFGPAESRALRIFSRVNSRIGAILMSAADDALTAVADQLDKAKAEILALVADLEASSVDPAVVDRLRGVAQSLDDVVPDVPPTP